MEYLLKGLIAGFIIAAPFGPVAVLCFRRVLTERRMVGIVTVLGAATADALYGLLAALGVTAVTHELLAHRAPLRFFGGLFLLYLGFKMFRARAAAEKKGAVGPRNLPSAFFSTFFLMLANPTVIVSFIAVFAAIDLGGTAGVGDLDKTWLGTGVFLGSAAWWFVFEGVAHWIGRKLESGALHMINVVAGSFICAVGVWQLAELVVHLKAH